MVSTIRPRNNKVTCLIQSQNIEAEIGATTTAIPLFTKCPPTRRAISEPVVNLRTNAASANAIGSLVPFRCSRNYQCQCHCHCHHHYSCQNLPLRPTTSQANSTGARCSTTIWLPTVNFVLPKLVWMQLSRLVIVKADDGDWNPLWAKYLKFSAKFRVNNYTSLRHCLMLASKRWLHLRSIQMFTIVAYISLELLLFDLMFPASQSG